ncbi:hypothetical protein BV898_14340 [Hypsibius exemplaris]|uniref:non-specific serine/threonine protein kinase n=1 Tax=Hypsibius exemplaris TaxID=2072580 RepID=A0A9X6RJG9_HYPEX|nr:hypothetical protein BV898_14340 [Hypsibius exemplaris]
MIPRFKVGVCEDNRVSISFLKPEFVPRSWESDYEPLNSHYLDPIFLKVVRDMKFSEVKFNIRDEKLPAICYKYLELPEGVCPGYIYVLMEPWKFNSDQPVMTLHELSRTIQLETNEIICYTLQLLDALDYLYNQGSIEAFLNSKSIIYASIAEDRRTELLTLSNSYILQYKAIGQLQSAPSEIFLPSPQVTILMEYCAGGTLNALCTLRQLSEKEILDYLRQITAALRYLHQHRIIHGDIRGENVLLTSDEATCKVGALENFQTLVVDKNVNVDILKHISPEMLEYLFGPEDEDEIKLARIGPASDVWSIGCTALEMASGGNVTVRSADGTPVEVESRKPKTFLKQVMNGAAPDQTRLAEAKFSEQLRLLIALKVLNLDTITNEIKTQLLDLEHSSVVKYLAVGELPRGIYGTESRKPKTAVLMELYPGGTLHEYSQARLLPESKVFKFLQQITSAVRYLHELKLPIFHGDIKGDNIFLTGDKSACRLGDMERLVILKQGRTDTWGLDVKEGTLSHMSPEILRYTFEHDAADQVLSTEIGRASDIWSVGCTVLEMLGQGHVQFHSAENAPLTVDWGRPHVFYSQVKNGAHPDQSTAQEILRPGLSLIVESCLRNDPTERLTAAALEGALTIMSQMPVPPAPQQRSD